MTKELILQRRLNWLMMDGMKKGMMMVIRKKRKTTIQTLIIILMTISNDKLIN